MSHSIKRLRLQSRLIYTNLLLKVSVYYRIVMDDFASITPRKAVIYFPINQVVCQKARDHKRMLCKGDGVSAMQGIAGNRTVGVQEGRNKRFAVMVGTDIFQESA